MKSTIVVVILFTIIGSGRTQAQAGKADNGPIMTQTIIPLVSCEEAIIRENLILSPRDDKKIWSLITDRCAAKIDAVLDVCELVTDYNDPPCKKIIDIFLSRHYRAIVKNIIKERKSSLAHHMKKKRVFTQK